MKEYEITYSIQAKKIIKVKAMSEHDAIQEAIKKLGDDWYVENIEVVG